jgi:hypothetical protein
MKAIDSGITEVKLNTVARDIRVLNRPTKRLIIRIPLGLQRTGAVDRFAQSIMGRYLGRHFFGGKLAFVFQYQAEAPPGTHITQLQLTPRLNLTLVTQQNGQPADSSPQTVNQVVRQSFYRQELQRSSITIEPMVQRLSAREQRIESVSLTRTQQQQVAVVTTRRIEQTTEVERVEPKRIIVNTIEPARRTDLVFAPSSPSSRIVRRNAPLEAEAEEPKAAATSTQIRAEFSSQAKSLTTAPPSAPTIDLNRLTDQVMKAIDYRLLAHRERTGRM